MSTTSHVLTGRLRPASAADFSQYAKNLAWLLQCPLQAAQELLARAYGYADAHELRNVLSAPAPAGPFDDPPHWPEFFTPESPGVSEEESPEPEDLRWMRETPREARLRELVEAHADHEPLNRRQLGVLEAGFLCAPKVHRQLFARVKAGCLALEGDNLSRLPWLRSNWPIGFWPLLRVLYGQPSWPAQSPEDRTSSHPTPDPAMVELCRARAPQIYLRLIADVPPLLSEHFDEHLDVDGYGGDPEIVQLSAAEAGLYPEWPDALVEEIEFLLEAACVDIPDDEIDAVFESAELFRRSGATDPSRLHPLLRSVPGLTDLLAHWRLGQLQALSYQHVRDPHAASQNRLFTERQPWPGHRATAADETSPQLESRLDVSRDETSETDSDTPLSLWKYRARFYREAPGAFTAEVGTVAGFLIMPVDQYGNVVSPDDFFEVMDSVSAQHNDVWKVLQGTYFPSINVESISHWTEEHAGESIAVAHITLAPSFRGQGLLPAMLNMIGSSLDRAHRSDADDDWREYAQAAAQIATHQMHPEYGTGEARPLIPYAPSLFIIPVPGDEPTDRLVRPHLRGSVRPVRKTDAGSSKEIAKAKLMRHFLAMREHTTADIVCYDPWEYPLT